MPKVSMFWVETDWLLGEVAVIMRKLELRPQNDPSILSQQLQFKEESQGPLYVWTCLVSQNNSPQSRKRKKARPVDP